MSATLDRSLCTAVTVWGPQGDFELLFYGLSERDLMISPTDYVHEAMERRGLMQSDGYKTSVLTAKRVRHWWPRN